MTGHGSKVFASIVYLDSIVISKSPLIVWDGADDLVRPRLYRCTSNVQFDAAATLKSTAITLQGFISLSHQDVVVVSSNLVR